jgi:hypothetical protein
MGIVSSSAEKRETSLEKKKMNSRSDAVKSPHELRREALALVRLLKYAAREAGALELPKCEVAINVAIDHAIQQFALTDDEILDKRIDP